MIIASLNALEQWINEHAGVRIRVQSLSESPMDFRASNLPADALIRYAGATVTEQAFTTGIDHRFGVALFVGKAHGLGALLELSDNLLQGINGGQVGTSQLRYVQSTQPRYDTGRNVWWMELQFQAIQH